ncbi:MAG: DUF2963 domain-containing protein [Candidatus Gastranaerophilaceae bacterium]
MRTTNYNLKDETKISSVQEYDLETGKIVMISIYKRDGRTVSIIKKINPETGKVTSWVITKLPNTSLLNLLNFLNLPIRISKLLMEKKRKILQD